MNRAQFKKLFEPVQIGQMQLRNRIVMPPMGTGYAEDEGYVSQRLIDYYEARARGGVGLVIVEVTAPDLQCKGPRQLTLGDDRYVPGWQELITAIHKHGAKTAVQLQHSSMENRDGQYIQVGPSSVIVPTRVMGVSGQAPHELTPDEIGQIVQWFAAAAKRAKKTGFGGVEIHGAHQYLVASFLSSATNIREDKYGGTVENKARILVEILQSIREAVGPDYPVWPRLNAQEYGVENGVTIEETKQVVPLAVAAHSLYQRVLMVLFLPSWALGMGAGVLVGQNLGAGQPGRAERAGWLATGFVEAIMLIASLAILLWAEGIIHIFTTEPSLVEIASVFLRIATAGFIIAGLVTVLQQSISGAGDTLPPMIIGLVMIWLVQLPLAYFLSQVTTLGVYGVRWAIVAGMVVGGVAYVIYFRAGRWKRKRV